MAALAILWLDRNGGYGQIPAMLKDWRISKNFSQGECAQSLGLAGGARSFQRLETGENKADSDMVEKIMALTGGAVTAQDMHDVRLAWLRVNQPERFADPDIDAFTPSSTPGSTPGSTPISTPLGGVPACSRPAAPDHAIEPRVPGSSADEALAKEAK
jgi:transcriptional regulator with XRE-family HTH domain